MSAPHGAPAAACERALRALATVSRWMAWTADPDLPPPPHAGARVLRDAAAELAAAAAHLQSAADRLDPHHGTREIRRRP